MLYFSDVVFVSVISLGQKQDDKKAALGFPFVGWRMTNPVSEDHIQIKRGIAKQRLCRHLGWPRSYPSFSIAVLYTSVP